jgi:hypothetical protein
MNETRVGSEAGRHFPGASISDAARSARSGQKPKAQKTVAASTLAWRPSLPHQTDVGAPAATTIVPAVSKTLVHLWCQDIAALIIAHIGISATVGQSYHEMVRPAC